MKKFWRYCSVDFPSDSAHLSCELVWLLRHGAGVVVDDLPSLRETLPHQCKRSSEVILLALQVPPPEDERGVRSQKPKLQFRKIQLSHRVLVRVIRFVSRSHAIPAACDSAAPGKGQFRRTPVAHQKRVHIAAIPRGLLRAEDGANGFLIGRGFASRLRQWLSLRSVHEDAQEGASAQQEFKHVSHCQPPL